VPYYLYFDDNFWVLAKEYVEYRWLMSPDGDAFVRAAAGVVVTSDALEEFARTELGCRNVLRFSPVLNRELLSKTQKVKSANSRSLTAAFAGSERRNGAFDRLVAPALGALARLGWDIRVLLRTGAPVAGIGLAGAKFELLPAHEDFAAFVALWRSRSPQILVHPPVESANVPYKTPSIVLIASLLGAVPIVAAEPAFAGLSESQGVVVVSEQTREAWATAIDRASSAAERRVLSQRLAAWCAQSFAPETNEATIMALLTAA
jgi:hypothetical protein